MDAFDEYLDGAAERPALPASFQQMSRNERAVALRSAFISLQAKDPSSEGSVGRVLSALNNTRTTLVTPTGTVSAWIKKRKLLGLSTYCIAT